MGIPQWISLVTSFGTTSPNPSPPGTDTEMNNLSPAADRSSQILTDINNGSYICTICTDAVTRTDIEQFNFWHCEKCYNICHFQCIQRLDTRSPNNWQCPSCRATQSRLTGARCWCGEPAGTCSGLCFRRGVCPHNQPKPCRQVCHPGPCNIPCSRACVSLPLQVTMQPTSWNRFCDRLRRNSRGCGVNPALLCAVTGCAIMWGLQALLLVFWIKWHTEPYNYPFFDGEAKSSVCVFLFIEIPIFIVINGLFFIKFWRAVAEPLTSALNLYDLRSKRKRKIFARMVAVLLLLSISCGIAVLPFAGFFGAPDIVWNNMMKDSCRGFNIRMNMNSGSNAPMMIQSLTPNVPTREFYFAARLDPAFHSSQPFQYFHRISGSTPRTEYVAVDVDLQNRKWRIMKLSDADMETKWLGYSSAHGDELPQFSQISTQLLKNGTFTAVDKNYTHMHIRELNMTIHNMYQFNTYYEHEPFTCVYNTHGLSEDEITPMLENKWSNKPDTREVMRTAAFGHGRHRLDMCIKEFTGWVVDPVFPDAPKARHVTGIDDRNLVPLAILWAFRSVKDQEKYKL